MGSTHPIYAASCQSRQLAQALAKMTATPPSATTTSACSACKCRRGSITSGCADRWTADCADDADGKTTA